MDSNPSKSVISSPEIVRVPCRVSHESRDAINEMSSADDSMLVVEAEHTDASATVTEHIEYPIKAKNQRATLVEIKLDILFHRFRIPCPLKACLLFIRTMSYLAHSGVQGSGFLRLDESCARRRLPRYKEKPIHSDPASSNAVTGELADGGLLRRELAGMIATENYGGV